MKTLYLSIVCLWAVVLSACNSAQHSNTYTVQGEVSDSSLNGETVYLMKYENDKYIETQPGESGTQQLVTLSVICQDVEANNMD